MQIFGVHTDHLLECFQLHSEGGGESSSPLALFTWCSSKSFDRNAGRILRPSPHSHPAHVPWWSRLARLHHRPYGNQGNSGVAWLLGAGWLAWRIDLDRVRVGLHWLAGLVRLPGAGRRDDERDVDLLDSGSGWSRIWQRSGPLWS